MRRYLYGIKIFGIQHHSDKCVVSSYDMPCQVTCQVLVSSVIMSSFVSDENDECEKERKRLRVIVEINIKHTLITVNIN